jgi:hypothetical protein
MRTLRWTLSVALVVLVGACSHHSSGGGFIPNTTAPNNTNTNPGGTGGVTDPHILAALAVLNQSRASVGSAPLTVDASLCSCALQHASDCAACAGFSINNFGTCAHGDFKAGNTCGATAENQGIQTGVDSTTEDAAFQGINSAMMAEGPPPAGQDNHWLNITNPSETAVGIGLFIDMNGNLWVSEEFR